MASIAKFSIYRFTQLSQCFAPLFVLNGVELMIASYDEYMLKPPSLSQQILMVCPINNFSAVEDITKEAQDVAHTRKLIACFDFTLGIFHWNSISRTLQTLCQMQTKFRGLKRQLQMHVTAEL